MSGNTSGRQFRALCLAAAAGLVGIAGWYSPAISAALWHVFHPRGRVDYRGLMVRAPWGWTADIDPAGDDPEAAVAEGLTLRKLPPTLNSESPPQSLFVSVIAPDPGVTADQQTERWLQVFRATHGGATFNAVTPALPAGASCLSAKSHPDRPEIVWTCISARGGWVANFEGQDRDAPVFFQVVDGLGR